MADSVFYVGTSVCYGELFSVDCFSGKNEQDKKQPTNQPSLFNKDFPR